MERRYGWIKSGNKIRIEPMKHDQSKFILCPKDKGLARRHVEICAKCRRKKKCRAYKSYIEPCFPLAFFSKPS
jgi:hypothetical protein